MINRIRSITSQQTLLKLLIYTTSLSKLEFFVNSSVFAPRAAERAGDSNNDKQSQSSSSSESRRLLREGPYSVLWLRLACRGGDKLLLLLLLLLALLFNPSRSRIKLLAESSKEPAKEPDWDMELPLRDAFEDRLMWLTLRAAL